MTKTYSAKVSRDGRWWMISIPEIDGLTQARRLAEVPRMARELVAVTINVAVDDLDVTGRMATIRAGREEAARLEHAAAEAVRSLARVLVAMGIPLRDVGALLGASRQRAHQLVS